MGGEVAALVGWGNAAGCRELCMRPPVATLELAQLALPTLELRVRFVYLWEVGEGAGLGEGV